MEQGEYFRANFNCMLSFTGCIWYMWEGKCFPCATAVLSLCRNFLSSHQFAGCSGSYLLWPIRAFDTVDHSPCWHAFLPFFQDTTVSSFIFYHVDSFLLFFNSFPQPSNQNLQLKCPNQFLYLLFSLFTTLSMIPSKILVFTYKCYGNLFLQLESPISNFLF